MSRSGLLHCKLTLNPIPPLANPCRNRLVAASPRLGEDWRRFGGRLKPSKAGGALWAPGAAPGIITPIPAAWVYGHALQPLWGDQGHFWLPLISDIVVTL